MDEYKINKKQSWKNNNNIFNHNDTEATTHNLEGKNVKQTYLSYKIKEELLLFLSTRKTVTSFSIPRMWDIPFVTRIVNSKKWINKYKYV